MDEAEADRLAPAMEHLVNSFFALAFDPENPQAIAQANDALQSVDSLLGAPPGLYQVNDGGAK